jgi:hypothetical protein
MRTSAILGAAAALVFGILATSTAFADPGARHRSLYRGHHGHHGHAMHLRRHRHGAMHGHRGHRFGPGHGYGGRHHAFRHGLALVPHRGYGYGHNRLHRFGYPGPRHHRRFFPRPWAYGGANAHYGRHGHYRHMTTWRGGYGYPGIGAGFGYAGPGYGVAPFAAYPVTSYGTLFGASLAAPLYNRPGWPCYW